MWHTGTLFRTVKIFSKESSYHKRYVKDEREIISIIRYKDGPINDLEIDDFVLDEGGDLIINNYEYHNTDQEYSDECITKLKENIFSKFLINNFNFTVPWQTKNNLSDSSAYDNFFLDNSPFGHYLGKDYTSMFMVLFENDIPLGSVNIFTSSKFPNHFGFLGIKKKSSIYSYQITSHHITSWSS